MYAHLLVRGRWLFGPTLAGVLTFILGHQWLQRCGLSAEGGRETNKKGAA
jgi:hypothetical protein